MYAGDLIASSVEANSNCFFSFYSIYWDQIFYPVNFNVGKINKLANYCWQLKLVSRMGNNVTRFHTVLSNFDPTEFLKNFKVSCVTLQTCRASKGGLTISNESLRVYLSCALRRSLIFFCFLRPVCYFLLSRARFLFSIHLLLCLE